ncbi:hypothetical protein Taro_012606 [Colocasia esculenta]|uniref:Bifunctional inhibitor/plant lipid transfer protein/seed storage helical domain-containing protein n=1 Tax=Colocasia esculenta TaxID=4460 RepID=A0A843UE05_COLES|nr:hypothetical protein [Colocasia esculenta]
MGRRVVVLSPAVLVAAAAMVVVWGAGVARGDFASDQADCVAALQVGLSACLTYVEGRANSPPPDCCTGLRRVMGERPKCLCVLVRDGDDPHLGFKINAARAMSLPGVCSVPANTSYCPRTGLLKLDPNSKDTDVFKQLESSSEQGNALSSYDDERVTFVIGNMCPFPIWPAAAPNTGHPVIAAGGFFLPSGAARRVKAPPSWNGRLWARTGCDFDSAAKPGCQTGDCQGRLACNGSVGLPPATLVEATPPT